MKILQSTWLILLIGFASLNTSCNSNKETTKHLGKTDESLSILLKNGIRAKSLEKSFPNYSLQHTGQLSRTENKHRFTFDNSKISSKKLIDELEKSNVVISVKVLANTSKTNKPMQSSGTKHN